MVARTLTQHAVPTTFGLKVAGWLTGVLDAYDAAAALVLPVQVGGAAGTLAATVELAGDLADPVGAATALSLELATALGLTASTPWHTTRSTVTRLGDARDGLHRCVGPHRQRRPHPRPTRDRRARRGRRAAASSTMPHKANPVLVHAGPSDRAGRAGARRHPPRRRRRRRSTSARRRLARRVGDPADAAAPDRRRRRPDHRAAGGPAGAPGPDGRDPRGRARRPPRGAARDGRSPGRRRPGDYARRRPTPSSRPRLARRGRSARHDPRRHRRPDDRCPPPRGAAAAGPRTVPGHLAGDPVDRVRPPPGRRLRRARLGPARPRPQPRPCPTSRSPWPSWPTGCWRSSPTSRSSAAIRDAVRLRRRLGRRRRRPAAPARPPDRVTAAALVCTGARIGDATSWSTRVEQVEQVGTRCWSPRRRSGGSPPASSSANPDGPAPCCTRSPTPPTPGTSRSARRSRPSTSATGWPRSPAGAGDRRRGGPGDPAGSARASPTGVKDGRLVVLDHAAHLAPAERPAEVARLIRRARPGREPRSPDDTQRSERRSRPSRGPRRRARRPVAGGSHRPDPRVPGLHHDLRLGGDLDPTRPRPAQPLDDHAHGPGRPAVTTRSWRCTCAPPAATA